MRLLWKLNSAQLAVNFHIGGVICSKSYFWDIYVSCCMRTHEPGKAYLKRIARAVRIAKLE